MALRMFVTPDSNDEDLPWVNEYVVTVGKVGDSFPVVSIKKSSRGLLILTDSFKGFLFAKSEIYKFLLDALSQWTTNAAIAYPLFAIALDGGKLTLAVDDEMQPSTWVEDKKGVSWEQKLSRKKQSGSNPIASNPFLPTPPPTTSGKNGRSSATTTPLDRTSH